MKLNRTWMRAACAMGIVLAMSRNVAAQQAPMFKGQPAAVQLDSARTIVASLITPSPASPPPPAPPAEWLSRIGEYGSPHSPVVILENKGSLCALFDGVRLECMRQISKDLFALPGDSQRVEFARAKSTKISGLKLTHAFFNRRAIAPDEGATFRILPLRPVEELRKIALAATPPVESSTLKQPDLVELQSLDGSIHYDIRYATTNNFMGAVFYSSPHAFMQRPAAEALARAAARLKARGYGLVIHDAYRPWYVTKMFWDATPDSLKDFVADPASGSRHNRGAAVDLSLYDLTTGKVVTAVSGYDEFSPRAYPDYAGGTTLQRWYRALLRSAMEAEGFTVYRAEWWHFDYNDWKSYPIGNKRFEDLAGGH